MHLKRPATTAIQGAILPRKDRIKLAAWVPLQGASRFFHLTRKKSAARLGAADAKSVDVGVFS
jgi:hypothetical protein